MVRRSFSGMLAMIITDFVVSLRLLVLRCLAAVICASLSRCGTLRLDLLLFEREITE